MIKVDGPLCEVKGNIVEIQAELTTLLCSIYNKVKDETTEDTAQSILQTVFDAFNVFKDLNPED